MIAWRYYIIACIVLSSCLGAKSPGRLNPELETHFTNRFEGTSTGLAAKLDIKGYYHYVHTDRILQFNKTTGRPDTSFIDILFYEDGSFASTFPILGYNDLETYFNSIIAKGKEHLFYTTAAVWGIYSLSGDTIKAQFLMYPSKFTPTNAYERWYVITGKKSFRLIQTGGNVDPSFVEETSKSTQSIDNTTLARFIPVKNIPPPLTWMKTRKFFWRNEEDWKSYNEENRK